MPQDAPAAPATPTAPAVAGTPSAAPQAVAPTPVPLPTGANAREVYEAMRVQRQIVREQLYNAEQQRDEIARELRSGALTDADKAGLEARLRVVDQRIVDLEAQFARAQAQEAQAAAVPGAHTETIQEQREEIIEIAAVVTGIASVCVLFPLMVAYAWRWVRRTRTEYRMPPELTARLDGLDRSVEAVAIEVERIGEGQRFVSQLMAPRREGLPSHAESDRKS